MGAPSGLRAPPLAVVAVLLLTPLVYLPSLGGGFLIDDDVLLTRSPLIAAPDGWWRFWFSTEAIDYWPLSNTSLWLEWRLWGEWPPGYRLSNLLLHVAEALLLWRILLRLAIPGAALAALLFALHPVNVETVAWISQRKTLLAMLFVQLSALLYLRAEAPAATGRLPAGRAYWLAVAAFALALLSKISVAVFPPLLALLSWWRRPLIWRDAGRLAPFFALAALLGAVNVWYRARDPHIDVEVDVLGAALRAGCAVWFYLSKALLPLDLAFMYPPWRIDPGQAIWWLPLAAAAAVTFLLWRRRHGSGRAPLFAWAFYCVALSPAVGLTETPFVEDHYQHLALAAVVAFAAAGWARLARVATTTAVAVAVATVAALAVLTWRHVADFSDNVTLMRAAVAVYPEAAVAHRNLAFALLQDGEATAAKRAAADAVALDTESVDARKILAAALAAEGDHDGAVEQLSVALRLGGDDPETLGNMGAFLRESGRAAAALPYFERALRLRPRSVTLHCNLGKTLLELDRGELAMWHFEEALRIDPGAGEARRLLDVARQAADGAGG
jgi:protein O-mannosyl-transferase